MYFLLFQLTVLFGDKKCILGHVLVKTSWRSFMALKQSTNEAIKVHVLVFDAAISCG